MITPTRRRHRVWLIVAVTATLTACGATSTSAPPSVGATSMSMASGQTMAPGATMAPGETMAPDKVTAPLRKNEVFDEIGIPAPYTPHADVGTDDYRCFLIDPHLDQDKFLTGITFQPDQAKEVHHAILYRVDPAQVAAAKLQDAKSTEAGWPCFGGAGMSVSVAGTGTAGSDAVAQLDAAPWLSAWAPGGKEQLYRNGIGVPLKAHSMIVLQVHYNLRNGTSPDQTHVRLRLAPGTEDLKPLTTMLLPAPVELPCAPTESGPLCDRNASMADLITRFGMGAGSTVAGLQLLCGGSLTHPKAGPTQHCDRRVTTNETVQAAAGHMHLLGKSISIVLNPGTPTAKTILDIPVWNFDNQGARQLATPIQVKVGDTLRVTCTHDASLRQKLPALHDLPPRYVTWGDGTADEMCLGVLLVTKS